MGSIFGVYNSTGSPKMKWTGEYTCSRTSNSAITVTVKVTGEIVNHVASSYMGNGNPVVVHAKVNSSENTYTIKTSTDTWYGNANNPRSHEFTFSNISSSPKSNVTVSYWVDGSNYTAAAKVPTQKITFTSPKALYSPSTITVAAQEGTTRRMGSALAVTIQNNDLSVLNHKLYYSFETKPKSLIKSVAINTSSTTWTPNASTLSSYVPDSKYGSCTMYCETYSGTTLVGSTSYKFNLYIPESYTPSLSGSSSINSGVTGFTIGIQNYSTVTLRATSIAASNGARPVSCSFSGGGYSKTVSLGSSSTSASFTTGKIKSSGTITFTIKVTDSRGLTATATTSKTINAYSPPQITNAKLYRTNSSGMHTPSGTSARYIFEYTYTSLTGNSVSADISYKTGSGSYTGTTSVTSSSSSERNPGWTLASGNSYTIRFRIKDSISDYSESTVSISTELRSIHIKAGGNGIAFGKVAESENYVDSVWPFRVTNSSKTTLLGTFGSNGNHGLYNSTDSKWIVYADNDGNAILPGTADKATTLAHHTADYDDLTYKPIPFINDDVDGNAYELKSNSGMRYLTRTGTTSTVGSGALILGNAIASGSDKNKYGAVRLYGNGTSYAMLRCLGSTANRTLELPDASGTLAIGESGSGYLVIGNMAICWGKITAAMASTTSGSSHYYSNSTSISGGVFAKPFSDVPESVILTGSSQTSTIYNLEVSSVTKTEIATIRVHRSAGASAAYNVGAYYVAFGPI